MAPEQASRRSEKGFADARPVWGSTLVTLILFAAIGVETNARDDSGDASDRHDRIRNIAQTSIPLCVGDWLGRDVEPTRAAVALLRPNVLISRAYQNVRTGETASLLFVHCSDARDLLGHYPPACYPAHGRSLLASESRDWIVGVTTIRGVRYRFAGSSVGNSAETVVDNFMVLPAGGFGRDMDAVNAAAGDVRMRHFGAAEMQIVTDGEMDGERRDEIFRSLVAPTLPLLEAVGSETQHD